MQSLRKPTDSPEDVFRTCISQVRDSTLKGRLSSVCSSIVSAASEYESAAEISELYKLPVHKDIEGIISSKEMSDVYDLRMARQGTPGRAIYDRLRASPPHGRCPLCGQRIVSTLDHYLPKASFPAYAVLPTNLIPVCSECNKEKHQKHAICAENQFLHPYYDNVDDAIWLCADVVETTPAAIRFYVVAPAQWSPTKAQRLQYHFKTLKLAGLYGSYAASALVDIRDRLCRLYDEEGPQGIRNYLLLEAASRKAAYKNSWQSAFYSALAENEWYCEGGFRD
jgi:hypothetical protein